MRYCLFTVSLCSFLQQGQLVLRVKYVVFQLVREFTATLILVSQEMAGLFGEASSDDELEQPYEYSSQVNHLLNMSLWEPALASAAKVDHKFNFS